LAEAILHVHTVGMEFNLNHLPDDMILVLGFCRKEAGVVRLNVVSQVDTLLHHG
jgi:hypothetical protein